VAISRGMGGLVREMVVEKGYGWLNMEMGG
jgi:hypothetical protein